MHRPRQMPAAFAVLLTLLSRVDGQCFTTTYNCSGATKNLESEEDCCLRNGLSYGDGLGCQICYVIGYSDDTRTQTINEGESLTLTVEIKKPALGVGSQLIVVFQVDSTNSSDIGVGGDSTQTGIVVIGTENYTANISVDAKADQISQEGVETFAIPLSVISEELAVPVFVDRPAMITVNDRSEVLVELTESMYQMREDLGSIVSRISYSQELANNITINFYPVTYNHYRNVLGLHLPDELSLIESHAQEADFIDDIITVTLPQTGGGSSREVEVEIPLIDDEIVEMYTELFFGYIEIVNAVDIGTIVLGRNTTRLIIIDDDSGLFRFQNTVYHVTEDEGVVEVCITPNFDYVGSCPFPSKLLLFLSTEDGSAVAPMDYHFVTPSLEWDICETRRCMNLTLNNDMSLEKKESFYVKLSETAISIIDEHLVLRSFKKAAKAEIKIIDDELDIDVGLESTSYQVAENFGEVKVCVTLQRVSSGCTIGFPFSVNLSTTDGSAVLTVDYEARSVAVTFEACMTRVCEALSLVDDDIAEGVESFYLTLERPTDLDSRIILNPKNGEVMIHDDERMTVGFSKKSYVTTERDEHISICVNVLNTADEGALQPFTVGLLPEPGFDTSNHQYILECSVKLHFDVNDKHQCHNYTVIDDDVCEVHTSEIFKLRLALITTNDSHLQIHDDLSLASAWIDDTNEPECFVRIGYKQNNYTLHEEIGYVEVCVVSSSPGIQWEFVINVTTTVPKSNTTAFDQSVWSLNFINGSSDTQCYNITVDFDMDNYCEQYFSCNNTLQSQLTTFNASDHVILINDMVEVFIKEQAGKCAGIRDCIESPIPTKSSSKSTLNITAGIFSAIISLLVFIAMTGLIVLILFYRRKSKQLLLPLSLYKRDSFSCEYPLDKSRRATLLRELREELKNTNMIFNKDQLQLTSAIGQGESGLVYKAYIDTAVGKELVAVKTGKALFSTNDIERMTKEVSAMLNFKHPNVMSLIGVCLDGEMPLIIMPFMSNGSVLEFVKSHREEMYICSHEKMELIQSTRKIFLGICHQISKGMAYLSEQKFVHRDLAARNCMIDCHEAIKVADFGLTEDMYGTKYFRMVNSETGNEEKVPIRWMAPESIENDIYNQSSDVWSFGVTVWEIFTCGRVPYPGVPAMNLLRVLQRGERLEKPQNASCSDEIYEIMMSCWNEDHHKRPRFSKLVNTFSDLLESDAGYLQLSQLPISKEKENPQTSSTASGQPGMTMNEAAEEIELDEMP